jgi:hypothetical protein
MFSKNSNQLNDKYYSTVALKDDCYNLCINDTSCKGVNIEKNPKKCYLYSSQNLETKNNFLNDQPKYNSYIRRRDIDNLDNITDMNRGDELFFKKISNYDLIPKNSLINIKKINDTKECMDLCLDSEKCQSFIVEDLPVSCQLYKGIQNSNFMKVDRDFDSYILNRNLEKAVIPDVKRESSLYSKCNQYDYSNYAEMTAQFDKGCKKTFGQEYMYDFNIEDENNVIDCQEGGKRVKCGLNFGNNNVVERFSNNEGTGSNKYYIMIFLFFIIVMIGVLLFMKKK